MERHVWVELDIPLAQPALVVLKERLAALDPKIVPYGGVRRRVRLTVDSTDALDAAQRALEKLALAIADWGNINDAIVDEVRRVEAVDPRWEALANE